MRARCAGASIAIKKTRGGKKPSWQRSRSTRWARNLSPLCDRRSELGFMPDSSPLPVDYPRRIVCLTDETTEVLYLLGEQERVVGISAYASRPPEARSKPRVSAFKDANYGKILDLTPDLVLTFSDVQAEITRELVLRGATVMNFNQRSIAEILDMIALLSRLVRKEAAGAALIGELQRGLDEIAEAAKGFARRPRVYFEEWNDPLI